MAGSGGDTSETMNNAATTKSWSAVASMNISKRNQTNTLEVRLENDEKKGCTLNTEEIERLLKRLGLRSSQFTSVQACPERRSVVFITLCPGVDINKFINMNSNESYFLKLGLRTTTIKHANKREVLVQVFGLHPDTRNETVIKYLSAHGQVDAKSPVKYGLYPGVSGSSLLAGKRNGNRTYSMVVKRNIGSSHVIDGEKVSIRYPGQIKTCNNCQQEAKSCPGKGLAKNCTLEKVLLSDFMLSYWKTIGFQPDTEEMNLDDTASDEDASEFAKIGQVDYKPTKVIINSEMMSRYGGVVIKGFRKDADLDEVINVLKDAGLPSDFGKEDLQIKEKGGLNHNISIQLKSETCVAIYNNLHGEERLGRKISVFTTVDESPIKQRGAEIETLIGDVTEACTEDKQGKSRKESNKESSEEDYHSSHDLKNELDFRPSCQNLINFFDKRTDLDISSDSDDESEVDTAAIEGEEKSKRKANESPESKDGFQTVSGKKGKKVKKNKLN